MKTKYDSLNITSLTPEQRRKTCGYWYVVTNNCTPHTAFRTRKAALTWLQSLNLTINTELAEEGQFQTQEVHGNYIRACIMTGSDGWDALPGIPTVALENGSYRPAKLDSVGDMRVLYTCNPNNHWAKEYNFQMCHNMQDQGVSIF